MSAGTEEAFDFHATKPTNDPTLLAPMFRAAVTEAIEECNNDINRLDAIVYETYRSNELQAVYYCRGRTVRPPQNPVTNAMKNLYSWHGYGLAVDVIHRTKQWEAGDAWFASVASIFAKHGCKWGGHWRSPDQPHFQWGLCKASPSDDARKLMYESGVQAVWEAVGAASSADV
jgi:hypothetical protein